MEKNLSPAELVHAYLESVSLVDSLTEKLDEAKTARNSFEFNVRTQLIQPNEFAPLLIDGNILVQLIDGYIQVSRVTKL